MDKSKLLTITVIGLLLINIATLGFLFIKSPKGHQPPGHRNDKKEIIITKLHFDVHQQKEYKKLIQWHRGEIERNDNEIRDTKTALYHLLSENEIDSKRKDSLMLQLNKLQMQIETAHFKHFEDIKKLCSKDQLEDFNELTHELGRIFSPNKPHKHGPPRHE
jgi:periplasmic protein CpxP/Spy